MLTTEEFLGASPAPPLVGSAAVAERLVLLVHRGVDFDVWGGARRVRYWDALTDRVRAGTYRGATLGDWWEDVTLRITAQPRTPSDRAEVVSLLAHPDQRGVLNALRNQPEVLVLRVRVAIETRRASFIEASAITEET